jgi:hypothetical protein
VNGFDSAKNHTIREIIRMDKDLKFLDVSQGELNPNSRFRRSAGFQTCCIADFQIG